MSLVAVFIFKLRCSGCNDFKTIKYSDTMTVYDEVKKVLKSKDVDVKEFLVIDHNLPEFLKITKFYPTCFLMPRSVFENASKMSPEDIYNQIAVFGSRIERKSNGEFSTAPYNDIYDFMVPMNYGYMVDEFIRNGTGNSFEVIKTGKSSYVSIPRMIDPNKIEEVTPKYRILPPQNHRSTRGRLRIKPYTGQ